MAEKSSDEIDLEIDGLEKELREANADYGVCAQFDIPENQSIEANKLTLFRGKILNVTVERITAILKDMAGKIEEYKL